MARSFHRKRSLQPQSELNVTALIDLGFALLIIFMISTPLIEKEQAMEISLPVASQSASKSPPKSVEVVVLQNGFNLDGKVVGEPELQSELARFASMREAPVLNIKADADISYQKVVRLLDLLKQHKLARVHLATREE